MRILVVKTSSLGDVLHTLPALTDAMQAVPGIRFDWVVEEAFAEIPAWHPAVDRVIPVALRRWRKQVIETIGGGEWGNFLRELRARRYDKIIDAQGLVKSALITYLAHGRRGGLDHSSAREPWSALAYQERYHIPKGQHAIDRVRRLFAMALGYGTSQDALDYGITRQQFLGRAVMDNYLIFLHGTTWPSKRWPLPYWIRLARLAGAAGLRVYLPWGNAIERTHAEEILVACENAEVLPKMSLRELAVVLASARGAIGIDTGLAHLAAALSVPTVTLYGATHPGLTGTRGQAQAHLCAEFPCSPCLARQCLYRGAAEVEPACYQTISPEQVWEAAIELVTVS